MRGEETQIAGYLALDPGFDGTLCLPGTHCKWVRITHGRVTGFQTFCDRRDLLAYLAPVGAAAVAWRGGCPLTPMPAAEGAADAMADPHAANATCLRCAPDRSLRDLAPDCGGGRLSGLLIGPELARRDFWQDAAPSSSARPTWPRFIETRCGPPAPMGGADGWRRTCPLPA